MNPWADCGTIISDFGFCPLQPHIHREREREGECKFRIVSMYCLNVVFSLLYFTVSRISLPTVHLFAFCSCSVPHRYLSYQRRPLLLVGLHLFTLVNCMYKKNRLTVVFLLILPATDAPFSGPFSLFRPPLAFARIFLPYGSHMLQELVFFFGGAVLYVVH